MLLLCADIVPAHTLPAGAEMAVEEREASARRRCFKYGSLEIVRKETGVSVH
jgi:hypothetical protein